ncbi:hypothetical protein [Devosia sp. SL43]|uniref:hypothetical protein n=1 Tax=Devosia sp. SL43 TaxID=2806348 RepID=UPI001F3C5F0C|nr:hypothetical protein [Devosia sp. SL43]UJW86653.1 hypothetical protein IM737_05185 [Devosia sp. SL43]
MRSLPVLPQAKRDWAVPAGLLVAIFLLVVGGNLAGNGVPTHRVPIGDALPGWEDGSLFSVLAVWIASWLGFVGTDTALVLVYVLLASISALLSYRFLRVSDWPAMQALFAVALIVSHGVLLYAVTTASPEFLIILAIGALIPAQRRLEAVGDVQAIINYGLTLPLLLMAGPSVAALILLLVLAVPFREPEARQKPQVFAAMLLVAVVPALIIIAGVLAMAGRAGIGIDVLAGPFIAAFQPSGRSLLPMLMLLAATAPVALILLAHAVVPDRRRKLLTTLIALALPLYLAVGNSQFDWQLAAWTPAAVMMATVVGWLCTTRLRPWMRWLTLGLLLASSAASWLLSPLWADPAWLDGLMPIQLYGMQVALPGIG